MRCRYCFYEDEAANRSEANVGRMTEATADRLIEDAFAALDERGMVTFAFQGGEPTLAGWTTSAILWPRLRSATPSGCR